MHLYMPVRGSQGFSLWPDTLKTTDNNPILSAYKSYLLLLRLSGTPGVTF